MTGHLSGKLGWIGKILYNVLLLKYCAKYCLDPEPEPEPEHPEQEPKPKLFQSRNWNRNRNISLRFHNPEKSGKPDTGTAMKL